jgi:tryptophanyl-tRNA synthetase
LGLTLGSEPQKKRVISGMRPTGRLHIGHYFGALQNWVRLQNAVTPDGKKKYDCFYFIADWHALTSDYADTSAIAENTLQIMIDYLAAGLDPQKSVVFQQSLVPEHAELHLLLSMVTPLGWLERVPTYKEALENVRDKDLHTYGFLGYPVLQTADIVIYGEENVPLVVPVGEDQVSHVELSREIVRRFNLFYGLELNDALRSKSAAGLCGNFHLALGIPGNTLSILDFPLGAEKWAEFSSRVRLRILEIGFDNAIERLRAAVVAEMVKFTPVLQEPEVKLTLTPRIPGLDGRKMSKSYGNAITLSETDEEIRKKTKVMVTDPARKRRTDPGNPDVCPVYDWHKLFSTKETLEWSAQGCRTAGIGCIECKAKMADHLIEWITPVRERRVKWENNPKGVLEILDEGSRKARKVAQGTMERVREAVFGWEKKRKEMGGGGKKVASGE